MSKNPIQNVVGFLMFCFQLVENEEDTNKEGTYHWIGIFNILMAQTDV